jgi:hypothetical protein
LRARTTAIADGTPVYDPQGRQIGVAEHVMEVGIFEGVIVHTHPLPGPGIGWSRMHRDHQVVQCH